MKDDALCRHCSIFFISLWRQIVSFVKRNSFESPILLRSEIKYMNISLLIIIRIQNAGLRRTDETKYLSGKKICCNRKTKSWSRCSSKLVFYYIHVHSLLKIYNLFIKWKWENEKNKLKFFSFLFYNW